MIKMEATLDASTYPNTTKYLESLIPEASRILARVITSNELQNAISGMAASEQTNDLYDFLGGSISGYIFERFCYLFLKPRFDLQDLLLLSPQQTLDIYSLIYPDALMITTNYGLQKGLEGISMPDGLLLKPARRSYLLQEGLEYSLTREELEHNRKHTIKLLMQPQWFTKSMHHLEATGLQTVDEYLRQQNLNHYKRLFIDWRNLGMRYVYPQNLEPTLAPKRTTLLPIPIGSKEIGELTYIFSNDLKAV